MSWEVLSTQRWASLNSAENSAVKFQQERSAPAPLQSVAEPSALGCPMLVPQPARNSSVSSSSPRDDLADAVLRACVFH